MIEKVECKIKEYPIIYLFRGGVSIIKFNFINFDFKNGLVYLTIKRKIDSKPIFSYTFNKREEYKVLFDKEFTENLSYSEYIYDLVFEYENNYYPLCLPSQIIVKEVVKDV